MVGVGANRMRACHLPGGTGGRERERWHDQSNIAKFLNERDSADAHAVRTGGGREAIAPDRH
jgi:hypothetical protein